MAPDKDGKLICLEINDRNSEGNKNNVLIYLPNSLDKPCIERLEKSGLDTPIRNISNAIISFKINLDYFHPEDIFCLGSMAMITFHRVKQGHLLHVGQCIIYNVYVYQ